MALGDPISSFPNTDWDATAGLVRDIALDKNDGSIWLVDNGVKKVFNITTTGTLVASFSDAFDPGGNLFGIGQALGGNLWISGITSDVITEVDPAAPTIAVSSFPTTNINASAGLVTGIAYDDSDDTLWVYDQSTNTIYNTTLTGSPISSFIATTIDASIGVLQGIALGNGGDLWASEATLDKIYKFDKTGTLITSFTYATVDAGLTVVTGLIQDSTGDLYLAGINEDLIWKVTGDGVGGGGGGGGNGGALLQHFRNLGVY